MNIADITKQAGGKKTRRRVGRGRGTGNGKTCGRGNKGAGQRSGWTQRGMQQGGAMPFFRRIPKVGFSNFQFETRYSVVNVSELEAKFDAGAHVTPQAMHEAGVVRHLRHPIKILGSGELSKKLTVDAAKFSESAKKKIESAGGEARVSKG